MLRSRSNRQQRAGELSGPQRACYGGYGYPPPPPLSSLGSSGGSVSVAPGTDDAIKAKGSGATAVRNLSFGNSRGNSGGRKSFSQRGSSRGGGRGGGGGKAILLLALIALIACFGVASYHYTRAVSRLETKIMVANNQAEIIVANQNRAMGRRDLVEGEEEEDDDDDLPERPAPVAEVELVAERDRLRDEIARVDSLIKRRETEIAGANRQIKMMQEHKDLADLDNQVANVQNMIAHEKALARGHKRTFLETLRQRGSPLISGGPGQALAARREVERMESLEDYEGFVQRRESALWTKVDLLARSLSEEAGREVVEWFGPGPHRVDIEVEYPQFREDRPDDPSSWPRVTGTLEVEMAPLSLMPVAVNLFLMQVHHGLLAGCHFVISAHHILQAGPHAFNDAEDATELYRANVSELRDRFESSRLDRIPFQEYNAGYPHVQHTLGYAGRPGGLEFYVNMVDNSDNHGPGGQTHHDLHEEADPCFGRIVGGFDVLEDIGNIPVDGHMLKAPVRIEKAVVVTIASEGKNTAALPTDGKAGEDRVALDDRPPRKPREWREPREQMKQKERRK